MNQSVYFFYRIFGLKIQSELELPLQVEEGTDPSDISLCIGKTPLKLDKPTIKTPTFQVKPGQFLVKLKSVGDFYVENGAKITVNPAPNAEPGDLLSVLMSSAFVALMIQRNIVPLHSSAVLIDSKAHLFLGNSGVGKSTITAALTKMGHKFLCDDVAPISLNGDGTYNLLPATPAMKLWTTSLEALNTPVNGLAKVRGKIDKYVIPVPQLSATEKYELGKLYFIDYHAYNRFEIRSLRGQNKIESLYHNVYRKLFARGNGSDKTVFQTVCDISKQVEMVSVFRPTREFSAFDLIGKLKLDA